MRVLDPESFKDLIDDLVEGLAEEEGVSEEMVVFVLGDVTGGSFYSASNNNPADRLHLRCAFGENGEGVKSQELDRGLQGMAMGGLRGALLGTGVVTMDELGPEATGVALENLGRVPDPHEIPDAEDRDGHQTAHISRRDKSSQVELEEVDQ